MIINKKKPTLAWHCRFVYILIVSEIVLISPYRPEFVDISYSPSLFSIQSLFFNRITYLTPIVFSSTVFALRS